MKPHLAAILLVVGLTSPMIGQSVVEPPEYPDGFSCSPAGTVNARGRVIAPDHKCECHRMAQATEDDPICETAYVHEDAKCLQFCRKNHCSCPIHCELPAH